MLKVLELFSGTGSVGKCCKQLGWDVVSVDLLLPADHQVDRSEERRVGKEGRYRWWPYH